MQILAQAFPAKIYDVAANKKQLYVSYQRYGTRIYLNIIEHRTKVDWYKYCFFKIFVQQNLLGDSLGGQYCSQILGKCPQNAALWFVHKSIPIIVTFFKNII